MIFKLRVICLFSFLFLLSGCVWYSPERLCNFPVHKIDDIDVTGEISPEPLFMGINVNSFAIVDTFLLSYNVREPRFVSVYSLNTGEELGTYCRHGRGPDEILVMMPFFQPDSRADSIAIFDAATSLLRFWNLQTSISEQRDTFSSSIQLNNGRGAHMSALSMYKLDSHRVLTYDTFQGQVASLPDVPRYRIFNYKTGEQLDSILCFNKVPLKHNLKTNLPSTSIMSHASCLDYRHQSLFMAMNKFPLVSVLNLETGKTEGFLLKGLPPQDDKVPRYYFSSATATENFVYCLYFGGEQRNFLPLTVEEEKMRNEKSTLFVFDWGGTLCAKYQLDDVYERCQVFHDNLYLSKMSLVSSGLYKLPLSELNFNKTTPN